MAPRKPKLGNSLAEKYPDVAKEWHPTKNGELTPWDVSRCSSVRVWWQCSCGHEWDAVICDRVRSNSGCPYCNNRRLLPGFNDLVTRYPDIAREWHPTKNGDLTAFDITYVSHKKVWWIGKCGHEWDMSVNARTYHHNNCPYCSNKRLLVGFNDLATTHPDVAAEWNIEKNGDLTPKDLVGGSGKRVWWKCSVCGNEWESKVYSRTTVNGRGCSVCSRQRQIRSQYRKIRCTELNQVFESISVVAEMLGVRPASVGTALKHGTKCGGYHWEYVENN